MVHSRIAFVFLVLGCALALPLTSRDAVSAKGMEWSFSELNDPENKGRMTARLAYGVPETGNIQVTGICDAAPSTSAKFSGMTFGADIGSALKDGAQVDLHFTGGGFDRVLKGSVRRPSAEEGIVGVQLEIEHSDPLWQALLEKDQLDYLVPGYRASTLDLTHGRDKIKSFIQACRSYAEVILGDKKESAGAKTAASGGTSEKEAFEAAKELGTKEGWEAFLSNYPSGFHADLARAYIKKLGQGSVAPGNGVTGLNVTFVEYPGGVFVKNGPNTWVEQKKAGGDALRFVETYRSKNEVKLFDKRRKVHISLNIAGGSIWYAPDGSPLKKLYDIVSTRSAGPPPPPPSSIPQAAAAAELPTRTARKVSCKKLGSIRAKYSNRPTKITFVNNSGAYRGILWIDFEGHPKDYANLQAGQQITLDTFQSHPWMVTDGPGNCLQIALPRSGPSLVAIGKAVTPARHEHARKRCRRGRILIDGKCIRRRDAASYCGPGYHLQGNKCVHGYQKPKPQAQRPSWQIEAIKKGCKPGLAWSPQEGCHEND